MPRQNDLIDEIYEDKILAERLMRLGVGQRVQGMSRTATALVNNPLVAEMLVAEVGPRNIIEFAVTTLERRIAGEE